MSNTRFRPMVDWLGRPLCTHYSLVTLVRGEIETGGKSAGSCMFSWAFGSHSSGDHEVLGWWETTGGGAPDLSAIGEDLTARGVISVRWIRGDAESWTPPHQMRCFARAQFVKDHGDIQCSPRLLRRVTQADGLTQQIRRLLSRSVSRHGVCADSDEAAGLVNYELQRLNALQWRGAIKALPASGLKTK